MSAWLRLTLPIWLALPASGAQDFPVQRFDPTQDVGIDQHLGETVPAELRFTDEDGGAITFGDLFEPGRPVVLALVSYECPLLCGLVLEGALRSLRPISFDAGEEFTFVAVSIDPREGPELAAAKRLSMVEQYGRSEDLAGWRLLTGEQDQIERLAEAVGFRYVLDERTGEYAHAGGLIVLTPERELSRYFFGVEYEPRDLRLALVEASEGAIGNLIDEVLILCMQWDPTVGRYGLAIQRTLRIGGVLTVLAIGGFVFLSLRRESRARVLPEGKA